MKSTTPCLVQDFKPLLKMSDAELNEFHRMAGMHPPIESCRSEAGAFSLRRDVSVLNALETMDTTLRHLAAMLAMMAVDESAEPLQTAAAGGCGLFVDQLRGLRALVETGVLEFPTLPSADEGTE